MQPSLGLYTGTMFYRFVLRRLGMDVGEGAFVNGMRVDFAANAISLGSQTWFGSSVMPFPVQQREDGGVEIQHVVVGTGSLVAEQTVLHDCALGKGTTVGSLTCVASRVTPEKTRWVGSPAIEIGTSGTNQVSHLIDGTVFIQGNDGQVGADKKNTALFELGLWAGVIIESLEMGVAAATVGGTWLYTTHTFQNETAAVATLLVGALYAGSFVGLTVFIRRCCITFELGSHDLFSRHTLGWQLVGHLQTLADSYVRAAYPIGLCAPAVDTCVWSCAGREHAQR
jgi:hypothetical protein